MSRYWLDVETEGQLLDEVRSRRTRLAASALSVSRRTGQLAGAYADAYPWMDPGAALSLAQAGLAPDSPTARTVADVAALQAADDGEFDDPADDLADPWYETLWNISTGWAKPVVRTGFTILATPFEELQAAISSFGTALFDETKAGHAGLVSNLGEAVGALGSELADPGALINDFWTNYTEKAARSTGLLALGDLLEGKAVDLGEGFIPGGEIWEERQAAKHRLSLDGRFVTPGRLIARVVTEPGTTAWQLVSGLNDAAQNIILDPAAVALGGLSKAQRAVRAFQSTGLISALRKTVDGPTAVNHYLTSDVGKGLVRWLTETSDLEQIWRATGRAHLGVARRLAVSDDESTTFGILSEVLGDVVRERPTAGFISRGLGGMGSEYGRLFGGGARVRRSVDNSRIGFISRLGRLGDDVPAAAVNIWDPDDAARTLDLWMRNAQVPQAVRSARLTDLADLTPGDQVGTFEAVRRVMDDTEGLLVTEWGIKPRRARELTSLYADLGDDLRTFDVDDAGRNVDTLAPLRVNVEGQAIDARPTPGLITELVDDVIPLPDFRAIRRVTPAVRQLQRLYDSGLWKGTIDGLEAVMTTVWKPLQLLRGAYTVRVTGEEQVRMAAAGYDSMFRHPFSAIAWNLSVDPKSRLGRSLANAARRVVDPKGTTTVTGEVWDDIAEHASALSRGSAGHRGLPGEVLTGRFVKARYGQQGFYQGWATELAHEANDPVMRRVAGGLQEGDLRSIGRKRPGASRFDDVAEWFWSGTGQKWRKMLGRMEGRARLLTDPDAARAYLRQNYFDRLERFTGGNPDLVDLVSTGKLSVVDLRGFGHETKLSALLEESYDAAAPNFVKTPETLRGGGPGARTLHRLDRATERAFEALMSRPTNWLSRSPTFRQKYWERVGELIAFAPRGVQEEAIRAARAANIGRDTLSRMARTTMGAAGDRVTSLDDIDVLAKGYALTETKRLLYDLQKRSQFFDMARLVFPFGEAWKEIIGAWTGILRHNPAALRRFQQTIEGARGPSLLGEPEAAPGTGRGFFAPDPVTGEEVFHYPAAWAGRLLGVNEGGAGVALVGNVSGLNIVSATVLPGFGPVLQIPASHIIPNTPRWDDIREMLLPFGEVEGPIEAITPAWLEKIQTAFSEPDPQTNTVFANTIAHTQRALMATGRYDLHSVGGQRRLTEDATEKARILYVIRGLAQFAAPTGPAFSWTTEDATGNIVPVKILSDEYRRLIGEYGGDTDAAFTEWVRRYGVENVLATIPMSKSLVERPVTEKGDAWLRAHPDLEQTYPTTIGYFAPEPAAGDFDYTAYLRQFETGARKALSPAEQLALANDFLGRIQWEQAKKVAALRPSPTTSAWLAQVRDLIAETYPGFDGWVPRAIREQRPKPDEQITELRKAITNPTLAQTDAGQGTILYFSAIETANQWVPALPGNVTRYQQAKAAAPIRAWLRDVAKEIIAKHPDFARVWFGIFERELADDETIGAAA